MISDSIRKYHTKPSYSFQSLEMHITYIFVQKTLLSTKLKYSKLSSCNIFEFLIPYLLSFSKNPFTHTSSCTARMKTNQELGEPNKIQQPKTNTQTKLPSNQHRPNPRTPQTPTHRTTQMNPSTITTKKNPTTTVSRYFKLADKSRTRSIIIHDFRRAKTACLHAKQKRRMYRNDKISFRINYTADGPQFERVLCNIDHVRAA